jgi:flagellar hook-associated protein 2
MVKVGMLTKQNEYDRMYKKEVRQEWTKEAYANLYSDLTTFTTSTMSKYKMSATLNPQTVSSSKSEVATATANADAAAMTHYVNVTSMSSNAYLLTGNEGITRTSVEMAGSLNLKDLVDSTDIGRDGLSFTVSDGKEEKTITISQEELGRQTLNDLAAAFNGTGLGLKASYDANNDSFSLYNNSGGKANGIYMKANDKYAAQLLNSLNLHTVSISTDGEGETTSSLGSEVLKFDSSAASTTPPEILNVTGTVAYDTDAGKYTGLQIDGKDVEIIVYDTGTASITIGDESFEGTYDMAATGDNRTFNFN